MFKKITANRKMVRGGCNNAHSINFSDDVFMIKICLSGESLCNLFGLCSVNVHHANEFHLVHLRILFRMKFS